MWLSGGYALLLESGWLSYIEMMTDGDGEREGYIGQHFDLD